MDLIVADDVHVFDTATGHVGHHHWLLDLPTTYLPVVLLAGVIWISRGATLSASVAASQTRTARLNLLRLSSGAPLDKDPACPSGGNGLAAAAGNLQRDARKDRL